MRTFIYLGLTAIASAINPQWHNDNFGYALVFCFAVAMDIIEYFVNVLHKKQWLTPSHATPANIDNGGNATVKYSSITAYARAIEPATVY